MWRYSVPEPDGVGTMATSEGPGANLAAIQTLGALKRAGYHSRGVRDEMRQNLLRKIAARQTVFPGIVGFEETVIPALVNAILARHSIILLGLRGQAKSRLVRSLVSLLDSAIPTLAGCEIHDDPLSPICRRCQELIAAQGDDTPLAWIAPEARYVEKLATPDTTIADILGDVDPIRAARGGHDLSSELTMHYGLLPRAHRGIFALNELPDLAGRIQVGLFNILEEGDVQIKGYPIRLPLDVAMIFTANPEDYTARGKIVTPLKDRIGSEIRTHYPATLEQGSAITQQEAWTGRGASVVVPRFLREVVEGIAFAARRDKKIDQRSGVSQRLPIAVLELALSAAEQRALRGGESTVVPRIADVYAALPAITGKLELEYEGELYGVGRLARDLIRTALSEVFTIHLGGRDFTPVIHHFASGGSLKLDAATPASELLPCLSTVPGLLSHVGLLGARPGELPPLMVSAAEFVLDGLYAQKKIGRSEQRGFVAPEVPAETEVELDRLERIRQIKRQAN
jgi:magnesium chelatase subunit I